MSTATETKTVYVDRGREVLTSKALAEYARQGVSVVIVSPWCPQDKGRAERAMQAASLAANARKGKA
ncbi:MULTISPECIES: hypothetical protein [Comamonadaceae]|uniref:Integrase catalytic domain-containing protein n=1 Tax=Rhodoferax aquaticus TaxID=2527691 RepID=A0A515EKD9_9BURK|nr:MULTISPECIES: hypothetical protein [Comamonadaceae]ARV17385.1 hypothetical protein AEP_00423 [Curvibacter sp. AEP1-3]QDB70121.1 hypothetical protein [Curvibacter phage TJ1]QDL53121.1 hypothetical protein EXZ61_02460 [Rhodoferax aquaticus]